MTSAEIRRVSAAGSVIPLARSSTRRGSLVSVRTLFFLVAALALAPIADADAGNYAPSIVTAAAASGLGVVVSWLPGEQVAETYNVYGIAPNAAPVQLGTFTPTDPEGVVSSVAVAPGFALYAVSGVVAGVESAMIATPAAAVGDECIYIGHGGYVSIRCWPGIMILRPSPTTIA